MLRQRYVGLLACALLPLLGGCVQATRHSNTMVFGTNTTVGVKVGRDVHQMPNVLIAYDRQEAVIMPLLANTGEKDDRWNMLSPCPSVTVATQADLDRQVEGLAKGEDFSHACKFVGVRKGPNDFLIQDSYSVLASFGAKLKGNATENQAAAGLAQYFATGAAAQTLALNGGAAVIAVGDAASAATSNPSNAANAAAALGGDPVLSESGKSFDASWGKLLTQVGGEDDAEKRAATVAAAVTRAGIGAGPAKRINDACDATKSNAACLEKLADSVALFNTPKFFN